MSTVNGQASGPNEIGVLGESVQFEGVRGIGHAENHGGVVGINDSQSDNAGQGVFGESAKGEGVRGISHSPVHGAVVGTCDNEAPAVFGESAKGEGVRGISHSPVHGAVVGTNEAGGPAFYGKSSGNAGFFEGNVAVTGQLDVTGDIILANADFAEDFDVIDPNGVEPGAVMVLDDRGAVRISDVPYDTRVAGVVSGAGDYRPGVVLDRQRREQGRHPLALMGKVFCKVDAEYGPIAIGDLLTTSATPGHAMKATDRELAFGAILGKALRPRRGGRGIVPILVTLQ